MNEFNKEMIDFEYIFKKNKNIAAKIQNLITLLSKTNKIDKKDVLLYYQLINICKLDYKLALYFAQNNIVYYQTYLKSIDNSIGTLKKNINSTIQNNF